MTRRLLVLTAIALAAGGGAAQGSPDWVRVAVRSPDGRALGLQVFPQAPGTRGCVIHGGGPAPGIRVPGTCSTVLVRRTDRSATARFVERWDARRFRGPGAGTRRRLSHTFELRIHLRLLGGKVWVARSFGDFPPQLVR